MAIHDGPGRRSGLLVAWGSAFLAGRAPLARAAQAAAAADGEAVVAPDMLGLERLLGRLRADGVARLELVLPVPGDARGLPGPSVFSAEALLAGEGVLTGGGATREGLVPSVETYGPPGDSDTLTTWTTYAVAEPELLAPPLLTVAEAEADLRAALAEATRELAGSGTARWRPGLDAPLAELRRTARSGDGPAAELPGDHPPRACALLAQAETLAGVLALAAGDPGAGQTGAQVDARGSALRTLAHAVRRARQAAYNAADGARVS